ncbi:MAG TPA: PDZ domain-containing protein [Clostridiaceae bacterium]|nr:PDZ domain-containing protein [Clostridiaceae bacterium]
MDNNNFNSFGNNFSDSYRVERPGSFYTESFKKTKRKQKGFLFQLIIVSLISSIIGGAVVFAAFQFAAPAIEPSVSGYLSGVISQKTGDSNNVSSGDDNSETYKKVVIETTDSPVTAIFEKVSPSVVGIRVTRTASRDFLFWNMPTVGEGSGIIMSSDGYIMTNNHVIEGALQDRSNKLLQGAKIEVFLPTDKDKPYTATVVGRDSDTDLAVIKIDAKGLKAAEFGDSSKLKVGELAVAIGNPAGLNFMSSVTAGIISGLNRKIMVSEDEEMTYIQTDAAINEGNSGGALVNSEGKVIGVNTAKIAAVGYEGLGFAIPINKALEITQMLKESGYVRGKPLIGIMGHLEYTEEFAKRNNLPPGVYVVKVELMSPAEKAGIKERDIITKFDGQPVKSIDELNKLKNKHKPGDEVEIEVYRDGKTLKLKIVLGEDKG